MYSWATQRTVYLGMGRASHSFMVILDCSYPLLGLNLLSKMGAQIHFLPDTPQVTGPKGEPIDFLTTRIDDEYKLFETTFKQNQDLTWWLESFLSTWAEMVGTGKAKCHLPVVVELKKHATPVSLRQYHIY